MEPFNLEFLSNISVIVYSILYITVAVVLVIFCIVNHTDLFYDKETGLLSGTRTAVNVVNVLSILTTFTYINANMKELSPTDLVMLSASAISLASGSRYMASKS